MRKGNRIACVAGLIENMHIMHFNCQLLLKCALCSRLSKTIGSQRTYFEECRQRALFALPFFSRAQQQQHVGFFSMTIDFSSTCTATRLQNTVERTIYQMWVNAVAGCDNIPACHHHRHKETVIRWWRNGNSFLYLPLSIKPCSQVENDWLKMKNLRQQLEDGGE